MMDLVLASGSPRRRELLDQIGVRVASVMTPDVDESRLPDESARSLVERLAQQKAQAVHKRLPEGLAKGHASAQAPTAVVVLAADTVVLRDRQILGKPRSRDDFLDTFLSLANRAHEVVSGVAVIDAAGVTRSVQVSTTVNFGSISRAQAEAYWQSGEPADKAGGYAIQGFAARFVEGIHGSYSNVVGLPLYETAGLLAAAGILDI